MVGGEVVGGGGVVAGGWGVGGLVAGGPLGPAAGAVGVGAIGVTGLTEPEPPAVVGAVAGDVVLPPGGGWVPAIGGVGTVVGAVVADVADMAGPLRSRPLRVATKKSPSLPWPLT